MGYFLDLRDGTREEAAAYIKTAYKPVDWIADNGGMRIENLTDRFYVNPLSLAQQPGPGRTFYASLTAYF